MTTIKIGELIKFSVNQKGRCILGEGWSSPEERHCWSVSNTSSLLFDLNLFPSTDIVLQVRLSAFCHKLYSESKEVSIEFNNTQVAHISATDTRRTFNIIVSQELLNRTGQQKVSFRLDQLTSPKECGLKDTRTLGIDIEYLIIYNNMAVFSDFSGHSLRISEDGSGSILSLDKAYHRLINTEYANMFLELYSEGVFEELFRRNLIPANLLQSNLVNNSIVLSSQTCKPVYGARYPFSMLRDCARVWLEINMILCKAHQSRHLGLCDCHFSNFVQGIDSSPLWCDLGSITSDLDKIRGGIRQFIQTLSIPLQILASGLDPIQVRSLLHLNPLGIDPFSDHASVIPQDTLEVLIGSYTSDDIEASLVSLYKIQDSLDIAMKDMQWSSYRDEGALHSAVSGELLAKSLDTRYAQIVNIVKSLQVSSFLDIGCNDGLFSVLLLQLGIDGSSSDIDEKALDKFYLFLRDSEMHSPALGIYSFTQYDYLEDLSYPDIVLALALTHHLSLSQGLSFEQIAKRLHELTSKYVLTEFMPLGLGGSSKHPDPVPSPLPAFYTLDKFISSLRSYFADVTVIDYARPKELPSYSERILILCKKD